MNKRLFRRLLARLTMRLAAFMFILMLTACEIPIGGGADNDGAAFVQVYVSGSPPKKTLAGYPLNLNDYVTVEPLDLLSNTGFSVRAADGQVIVWSINDPAKFGVTAEDVADGIFTPVNAGTMTVTATVSGGGENGEDFKRNFTITVIGESEYVAVTDINGPPERAFIGSSINLSAAAVVPEDATYNSIVWSIESAGTTGASIAGGRLKAAAAGNLTLRGTVISPKGPYIQDFKVQIIGMPEIWTKSAGVSAEMPHEIQQICYGNGTFVAGSRELDGRIAYSTDNGVTWTGLDMKATTFWDSIPDGADIGQFVHVKFLNGKFWAVGGGGHMAYSEDGKSWNKVESPGITINIVDIAYGEVDGYEDGVFVAGGDDGCMSYSTDGGVTWTPNDQIEFFRATSNEVADFKALIWADGKFLAAGQFAKAIYSSDGITWTNISKAITKDIIGADINNLPSRSGYLGIAAAAYGNGLWLLASQGVLGVSKDLENWERVDMEQSGFPRGHRYGWINCLIYADGLFVMGGADGDAAYSLDGRNWSKEGAAATNPIFHNFHFINGLAYANGRFVAVGAACTGDCQNDPRAISEAKHPGNVGCIAYTP